MIPPIVFSPEMKYPPSCELLFKVIGNLIDDRTGIVRNVTQVPREAGHPDFFYFYAKACNAGAFTRQKNFADAGGASADRANAMAKAIGEAVERYCSAIYDREEFPFYSFESAPFQCIQPFGFALYSDKQYASRNFPFVPFEDSTPVRWAPTVDATTNEMWHVPASMVY